MTDDELQRLYRQGMQRPGNADADAPDPALLLRVAKGEATEAERLAVLDRVMQSGELRGEYDLMRALASAQQRRATLWPRLLAAAVVVLAIGGSLIWRRASVQQDPWRGGGEHLPIVAPLPDALVAAPVTLAWHPAAGATAYDIELLGEDGKVVWQYSTADTVQAVPATVGLVAGPAYRWSVTARLPDGVSVRSPLSSFRIRP